MKIDLALAVGSIERTLHQMFLDGGTHVLCGLVEEEQTFGKGSVVEAFGKQEILHHGLVSAGGYQSINVFALILLASLVQGTEECEIVNLGKEFLLKVGSGHAIVSLEEGEHILEHTACGTACGHKLENLFVGGQISGPQILVIGSFVFVNGHDSVLERCGALEIKIGEAFGKRCHLRFSFFYTDTFFGQCFQIVFCKHFYQFA